MKNNKTNTNKSKPIKHIEKTPKMNYTAFLSVFFFILILLIPNLYDSAAMDQQLEVRLFGLSVFLGILLISLLFIKRSAILNQSELNILKNPVVIAYAILIIIIGISIFRASNTSEAMYDFLKRITFFILFIYLIIFILPKENSRTLLIKSFIIFSLFIGIVGLFQIMKMLAVTKYSIESIYTITGNFAQKNIFSEVLFISFAFCAYGISIFNKIWKFAAITASLLTLFLIAFLMTRAIWAGLLVSLGLTLLIYLFYAGKSKAAIKLKTTLRYAAIIFGLAIIIVVAFSLTDKNKTLQHQITTAFDFKQGNTFHRLNLWKNTLSLVEKNPITGVGAGNWKIDILQYDLQVTTDKGRIMPDRTHNDYLQVLAETGIPGLLAFLFVFAFCIYYCIKTLKKTDNFQDSLFILILFFALTGYMVDSAFAFPRERPELQIFLNIIFALIVFEYSKVSKKEDVTKSQFSIKPVLIVLICITGLSAYAAYKRMQSEAGVKLIYKYIETQDYKKIIDITNKIYSPFSTITPFCDPILQIRGISMLQNKNSNNEVLESFENALRDSPYHLETLNSLALYYKNAKDYSKAMEYINTALAYGPNDIRSKLIKSEILLAENNYDDAYKILQTIDPLSNNKQYKNSVNFILYYKVRNLVSQIKNDYFISELGKASMDNNFFYTMYVRSLNRKQDFEKTILDSIFIVCNQDKINNDESLKKLKIKYQLK